MLRALRNAAFGRNKGWSDSLKGLPLILGNAVAARVDGSASLLQIQALTVSHAPVHARLPGRPGRGGTAGTN